MPTLLQRLFKPADVRVLLQAYRDEVALMEKNHPGVVSPTSGIVIIDGDMINSIVGNPGQVKAAVRKGDRSPRALVLLMILGKASTYAASGQHHTYRGMLSTSGTGLRNLVTYCLTELGTLGVFTPDEKNVYIAGLDADIKEVG